MATQYYTATSLDGFIATEDHGLEWLFPLGKFEDTGYAAFYAELGALCMGRSTYEWMLRHVPDWPYALPCWVFTHAQLPVPANADVRFVQGDVRPVHAQMQAAAGEKNLWVVGGGDLAGQFHDAGLLDELILTVGSVTLGRGKPLLPRAITQPAMTLLSVKQIGPGFAELRYALPKP